MRVLVCGGRDFSDYNLLSKTLHEVIYDGDHTYYSDVTIISGNARGADKLGERFARDNECKLEIFPADWDKYKKAAGHIRNQQMINEGKPDLVVAFKGGRGTQDMIKRAKGHGIKVIEVEDDCITNN